MNVRDMRRRLGMRREEKQQLEEAAVMGGPRLNPHPTNQLEINMCACQQLHVEQRNPF